MNIIIFLVPISGLLAGLGLCFFLWTFASGQYDDPSGDAERILIEDPEDRPLP